MSNVIASWLYQKTIKTVLGYNQDAFTFDIVSKALYKHSIRPKVLSMLSIQIKLYFFQNQD
jgi:hypothetical protein